MRPALIAVLCLTLGGCTSAAQWDVFEAQIGRTVADVTLVAGTPDEIGDLPEGRRVFAWKRAKLVPRGWGPCEYRLTAVREGRPESLAAWRVVSIDDPAPGCAPAEGSPPRY